MSVVLTRSRFINALRCYASYALNRFGSALFRTPYTLHRTPYTVHHTPLFVSVEPSAVCQLRCPACPVGLSATRSVSPQGGLMPRDLWERALSQIKETAWVVQFYFQGEPLLNKDLPLMIREAHDAGLYTIVSTNAQAMTPELANALVAAGLDRIIISMDGLTQETYEAYRVGGSLDQCKAALRWLQKAKSAGLTIELQVLRLRSNEHEWRAFRKEYKTLGADRLVFRGPAGLQDRAALRLPSRPSADAIRAPLPTLRAACRRPLVPQTPRQGLFPRLEWGSDCRQRRCPALLL